MARKKQTSISDIAKALGISITTVSFILNGKAKERRISDALNKRVLDYVKKVGYKPSQLVRNVGAGQAKVIALLVDDLANPLFSEVGKYMERIASSSGYQLIHCSTENDTQKTKQLIRLCADKEIDAVVMTPGDELEETILKIKKQHIPVVLLDRWLPGVETSYVVSDNRKGAYDATKHLLEMGGKRVGLISLYSNQTQMRERLDGYMDAMDEFQRQSFIKKLNIDGAVDEIGEQIIEFTADNKLDAVLFANHYLTITGLKVAKEQGAVLPRMVTFDDHILFALHTPAVSVVRQDASQLATELMQTLTAEIEGKLQEERKVVVPCTLVVRDPFTVQQR